MPPPPSTADLPPVVAGAGDLPEHPDPEADPLPALPSPCEAIISPLSLHQAAKWGDTQTLFELLGMHADPDVTNGVNGPSPLFLACRAGELAAVDMLLRYRADIRGDPSSPFLCPLLAAAHNGHVAVVRHLLANTADPEQRSSRGLTLLTAAACSGSLPTVQYLAEGVGCCVEHVSSSGTTAMAGAVCKGHLPIVKYLHGQLTARGLPLEPPGSLGLVHLAACAGNLPMVAILVELGADKRKPDAIGTSPLYAACFHGHLDVARHLVRAGVDVDMPTAEGVRPLHGAAYMGAIDVVRFLLSMRACPDTGDMRGRTPLHATVQRGHMPVVRMLLDAKADIHRQDEQGVDCLFLAICCEQLDTVRSLLAAGVTVNRQLVGDRTTPLQVAARTGNADIVRALLQAKAEKHRLDVNGVTAIHIAAVFGHVSVVKMLAESGADINLRDKFGITPLARAAYMGQGEVVRYLVDRSADVLRPDHQGLNALHSAAMAGRLSVCRQLCIIPDATALLLGTGLAARRWRLQHPRRRRPDPPLVLAAGRGHLAIVKVLARCMVDLGLPLRPVIEPATEAARAQGHTVVEQYLATVADWTPLHFAAAEADSPAVMRMLRSGADPLQADGRGVTAFDVALLLAQPGVPTPRSAAALALAPPGALAPVSHAFLEEERPVGPATPSTLGSPRQGRRTSLDVMKRAILWSPGTHHLFPTPFRDGVRLLLLVYERISVRPEQWLPVELWCHTIACLNRTFGPLHRPREPRLLRQAVKVTMRGIHCFWPEHDEAQHA